MSAGNPGLESFIRSALKPFQALPFLSSGTADQLDVDERGIAISCASHAGTNAHAREAFPVALESGVGQRFTSMPCAEWG